MKPEFSDHIHKNPPLIHTFIKINPTLHFNFLLLKLKSLYKNPPLIPLLMQTNPTLDPIYV